MLNIRDAVAVITGGGSGIGEAMAKYWTKAGGRAVLGDIDAENLARVEQDIRQVGGQVVVKTCDVTQPDQNRLLAALAVERFGALNLVCPCAGIIRDGLMLRVDRDSGKVDGKMSLDQFQSVIDINLIGVFLTVRECAEQMINHHCKGLICLISSVGALGNAGQINYASTKAAMSVMPKVICAEMFRRNLSHRIRCVAVAPGFVATDMVRNMDQKALSRILDQIPIQRLIDPEEVASLVAELYRNEALNGEVFYIHGGLRIGSKG